MSLDLSARDSCRYCFGVSEVVSSLVGSHSEDIQKADHVDLFVSCCRHLNAYLGLAGNSRLSYHLAEALRPVCHIEVELCDRPLDLGKLDGIPGCVYLRCWISSFLAFSYHHSR